MSGLLGIGLSGLGMSQTALTIAGHNIANASTPGFHRQDVVTRNGATRFTAEGFIGSGVDVVTVKRLYSSFLESALTQAEGKSAYLDSYSAQVSQIDQLLADPNAGLTPAIEEFFATVQDVSTDPSSVPSRQAMLTGAQTLVARFHAIESRLSDMQSATNRQIRDTVGTINALASQAAYLNDRIVANEAQGSNTHTANDLRDQRDHTIAELNKLIGVSTLEQSDGSLNIMVGSGQALVLGDRAFTLSAVPSVEDPGRLEVGVEIAPGQAAVITRAITTGALGGVLAFRNDTLDPTINAVGRVALVLADTFNAQHRLGQDLVGAAGGDFFAAGAPQVLAKSVNAGTAVLAASLVDSSSLTTSDYRIAYDAGGYTVTRLADGTASTYVTLPQTIDGVQVSLASGAPAVGDSFILQPTRTAARDIAVSLNDPRSIAAAAPIRTAAAIANTGSARIDGGLVNGPPPVNANLQQPVTITFTGANTFDVTGTGTGNPTGVAYSTGGAISYNGWTVEITGVPRAGDVFTIAPNTAGISDNRNALLLARLQTDTTVGGGTDTFQTAYSRAVAEVGSRTRELQITSSAQQTVVNQAREAQQGLSGVNLDEEAANLIRFQQAYQASAKVIDIASKLFDTLIAL